ncbi:MAG: hypothetical protein ACTHOK_14625 [Nocardioidaceae bacterium]
MSENDDTETYLEVWQQPDKMWRWRWVQHTGEDTEQLVSYMAFEELSGAEESAEESYPGLEVRLPEKVRRAEEKREKNTSRKRGKRSGRALLVLGIVVGVVLGRPRRRHRD